MKKCKGNYKETQKTQRTSIYAHIRAYQRLVSANGNEKKDMETTENPTLKIMTVPAFMEYLQTLEDGTVVKVELEASEERSGTYGR